MKKKLTKGGKKKSTAASTTKKLVVFSGSTATGLPVERSREERLRSQVAALGVMAKSINARLDAQARRDREIQKLYEGEPMISEPVWHVHHRR